MRSETKRVPVEPTEEMIKRGEEELGGRLAPAMHAKDCYAAMLAAAPGEPDHLTRMVSVDGIEYSAQIEVADEIDRLRALCALARDGLALREAIARGPVAYGVRNTAITGRPLRMMSVRLEVPSDDQYGGQLWTPLYALDD